MSSVDLMASLTQVSSFFVRLFRLDPRDAHIAAAYGHANKHPNGGLWGAALDVLRGGALSGDAYNSLLATAIQSHTFNGRGDESDRERKSESTASHALSLAAALGVCTGACASASARVEPYYSSTSVNARSRLGGSKIDVSLLSRSDVKGSVEAKAAWEGAWHIALAAHGMVFTKTPAVNADANTYTGMNNDKVSDNSEYSGELIVSYPLHAPPRRVIDLITPQNTGAAGLETATVSVDTANTASALMSAESCSSTFTTTMSAVSAAAPTVPALAAALAARLPLAVLLGEYDTAARRALQRLSGAECLALRASAVAMSSNLHSVAGYDSRAAVAVETEAREAAATAAGVMPTGVTDSNAWCDLPADLVGLVTLPPFPATAADRNGAAAIVESAGNVPASALLSLSSSWPTLILDSGSRESSSSAVEESDRDLGALIWALGLLAAMLAAAVGMCMWRARKQELQRRREM